MKVIGDEKAQQSSKDTQTVGTKDSNLFDNPDAATQVPVTEASAETIKQAKLPGVIPGSSENKGTINREKYNDDDLVITSAEKTGFIAAMLSGSRYTQDYTIFGGKITITIRSRTTEETQAMYAYIRHELSADGNNLSILETDMQYLMLVAQVQSVNGTSYPEMKVPLTYEETEGEIKKPGWMEDLKTWKNKPEGLISAIINRIQLFEYKYWTMVKEAANKNFWNSDTSTSI